MQPVPFVDLPAQYAALREDLDSAVQSVFRRGAFVLGPDVAAFERNFARYCGVTHAIGVGSGLDALTLGLRAAGIGAGDEVVTVANTFIATALAISAAGATPALVDCDEATHNMDVTQLEAAITPRTRAILPVHLFGRLANMEAILAIARRRGLLVIEDACQAHGAALGGRRSGAFGDLAAFSFYPGKNLGAAGEGGAVTTNDEGFSQSIRVLRNVGQREKYVHDVLGVNSRLDTVQAAVLDVKLRHLDAWNASRQAAAAAYRERLARLDLILPSPASEASAHVYHLFVVRVHNRARVQQHLTERGIQHGIHYPVPIHLHEAYTGLGLKRGAYPTSERLAGEILSLPMFAEITVDQIDRTCDALREVLG